MQKLNHFKIVAIFGTQNELIMHHGLKAWALNNGECGLCLTQQARFITVVLSLHNRQQL